MSRSKKPEPAYKRKKRLKHCKEQKRAYLEEMDANPKDPRHGTQKGYSYGCRCEPCCLAQRRYWKERGKAKRWDRWIKEDRKPRKRVATLAVLLTNPEHPDHGTAAAYWKGCRCERCAEAGREYNRAWQKEHRPSRKSQLAQDAREIAEGLEAYKLWLALGGTPEGWKECMEITVEC